MAMIVSRVLIFVSVISGSVAAFASAALSPARSRACSRLRTPPAKIGVLGSAAASGSGIAGGSGLIGGSCFWTGGVSERLAL